MNSVAVQAPRRWAFLRVVLLALALAPGLQAQAEERGSGVAGAEDETLPTEDASTPLFKRAVALQRKGKWKAARKLFLGILKKHPTSIHAEDIENRSANNAFLGVDVLHESGPPERRIDISVMGDGFTIAPSDQKLEARWAALCMKVLFNEKAFTEYQDYFNFYFVRLASKEKGVDKKVSAEQRKKIEKRNENRVRKRKIEYDTALDCKAAGPQGQVMSDRRLVYKWLAVAGKDVPGCANDRQVIAFARFGVLGMGGGGIANVGRPDRSVTVHEFGHSFVGLLDEYQGNPNPPRRRIFAANAATTSDPQKVPWAHFLKKKVTGVGVFEGGATHSKGVWRPARSCAMNSAGNTGYCPVCREAAVLRIYSYVNPIDLSSPANDEVLATNEGSKLHLCATPMRPTRHKLQVSWFVEPVAGFVTAEDDEVDPAEPSQDGYARPRRDGQWWMRRMSGRRGRGDRSAYKAKVPGKESELAHVRPGKRPEHRFPVGRLAPGSYRITVRVKDPTPWVLKDPSHLLEERLTWRVTVGPRQ